MFWMILVVIVLVVGAAALVALGGGGSLPEPDHDRLAADLPLERQLDRADVDGLRFPMALRGYRMDEVDDVLDRLGAELAQRDQRIGELEAALATALDAPAEGGRSTVLLAPRTARSTGTSTGSAQAAAPAQEDAQEDAQKDAQEDAQEQQPGTGSAGDDDQPEQP